MEVDLHSIVVLSSMMLGTHLHRDVTNIAASQLRGVLLRQNFSDDADLKCTHGARGTLQLFRMIAYVMYCFDGVLP